MKKIAIILLTVLLLSLTACQKSTTSSENIDTTNTVSTDAVMNNAFLADSNDGVDHSNNCYIANKNSKKLHYYTCDSLPAAHNRVYFSSEAAANRAGYTDTHRECMGH